MNFDLSLGISFFVCAIAIGISALLLSTPLEANPEQSRSSSVIRLGT